MLCVLKVLTTDLLRDIRRSSIDQLRKAPKSFNKIVTTTKSKIAICSGTMQMTILKIKLPLHKIKLNL